MEFLKNSEFSYNLETRELLLLLLPLLPLPPQPPAQKPEARQECGAVPLQTLTSQQLSSPDFYFPDPMHTHLIVRYSPPYISWKKGNCNVFRFPVPPNKRKVMRFKETTQKIFHMSQNFNQD